MTPFLTDQQRAHLLEAVSQQGLVGLSSQEFLYLTAEPLPLGLARQVQDRISILRVMLFRQGIAGMSAFDELQKALPRLSQMHPDDAFMLSCEAARIYLMLDHDSEAVKYLIQGQVLAHQVSPDLRDYWQIVLALVYAYLWDDEHHLACFREARCTLSPEHPYYLVWNPVVRKCNLAWGLSLCGHLEEGLREALEALRELAQTLPGSLTEKQMLVETMQLVALLNEPPAAEEFTHLRAFLGDMADTRLNITLSLAEALSAERRGELEAAHQAFQRSLTAAQHFKDYGRFTLRAYDHALQFYRGHTQFTDLVQVLEGRMMVLENLRRRATSMFQHLRTHAVDLARLKQELATSRFELVECLSAVGERYDDSTGEHTRRVGYLCAQIALELGLPDAAELAEAARLHDLGKSQLPDHVLLKPGPLNDAEWEAMKQHTTAGAQMLERGHSQMIQLARQIARSHHERWDGTGYPDGLRGDQIPLVARIVAVADVFDALTSTRPYKQAWSVSEACTEIKALSGGHFDPLVVEAFERVIASGPLPAPSN